MFRHKFLGTADLNTVYSLLNSYDVPTKILDCVKLHKVKEENDLILLELGTLLTPDECDEILYNISKQDFEEMTNKYDNQTRNNSRLVVMDDQLARTIWRRLKFSNKLPKLIENTKPLGFNVRGQWEMSGVNPAMRINKYTNDHFFAPHKDAQYAPNGDERSLLSLIIYLNDNYQQGETKFYFPKSQPKSDIKGLTIQEEIETYGGLVNGYECITIKPKKGYAVLFTHNLLHEATSPNTESSIERIILRSDVLVKRKDKPLGFAVCQEEYDDYMACLNFFRQAQQSELGMSIDSMTLQSIGKLYERSLSIRYCYPRLLEEKLMKKKSIDETDQALIKRLPPETWLHILKFLNEHDLENLIFAYPEFHLLKISWEAQEDRSFLHDPLKEKYLPIIHTKYGSRTLFHFSDAKFFSQHIEQCCRVAAVYACFLLGHAQDSKTYTVRYNQYTHEVCEVPLEKLLADVFYNRNCYGSLYRVKQQDENKRQADVDLNHSVDRMYMSNRHQSQFIGQDLLPQSHIKIQTNSEQDDDMDGDYNDYSKWINEDYIRAYERVCALFHPEEKLLSNYKEHQDKCMENAVADDVSGYREQLFEQTHQKFGTSLCRIVSADNYRLDHICFCSMDRHLNMEAFQRCIQIYNHLILDFDTHQLKVEQLSQGKMRDFDAVYLLNRFLKTLKRSDSQEDSISYYRVNIEKLVELSKGFNHASCQCNFPALHVNQFSFLDYTYLSHVNLVVVQNSDHVYVLTTYHGIAAF